MKKNFIIAALILALIALSALWQFDRERLSSQRDLLKGDIQKIEQRVKAAYQCGDDEIKRAGLLADYLKKNERPEQFAALAVNHVHMLRQNQDLRHEATKYIESILRTR